MSAVPLIIYAIQHYLSIAGSLVLIPLIIVPAMGGTPVSKYVPPVLMKLFFKLANNFVEGIEKFMRHSFGIFWQEDTSKVVSSMLMVSGLSTLLHTSFGSRLPLVQGASFVYLAPTLAIIFNPDFANLTKDVSDLPKINAFQIVLSLLCSTIDALSCLLTVFTAFSYFVLFSW